MLDLRKCYFRVNNIEEKVKAISILKELGYIYGKDDECYSYPQNLMYFEFMEKFSNTKEYLSFLKNITCLLDLDIIEKTSQYDNEESEVEDSEQNKIKEEIDRESDNDCCCEVMDETVYNDEDTIIHIRKGDKEVEIIL